MKSPIRSILLSATMLFAAVIATSSNIASAQTATPKPLGGGGGELAFVVSNVNNYSGAESNMGIFLIDSDGKNLHHFPDITSPPLDYATVSNSAENVLWSPDGKRIAFYIRNYRDSKSFLVSTDGAQMVIIGDGIRVKAWSPDSQLIAFDYSGGDPSDITFCIGKAYPFDTSDPGIVINIYFPDDAWCDRVDSNVEGHVGMLGGWSPNGQSVMFYSNDYGLTHVASRDDVDTLPLQLYIADSDGTHIQRLTKDGIEAPYTIWSPDGKHVTLAQGDQICIAGLDGSDKQCISPEMADITGFQWAPDGKHIAFLSGNQHDHLSLYVMTSTGAGFTHVTASKLVISSFSWSPDSKYLAFAATCSCDVKPISQIYVVGANGSGVHQLTNFTNPDLEAHDPVWQP